MHVFFLYSLQVLVSNAGFCQSGALEETSHEQRLAQFSTNFFGGEITSDQCATTQMYPLIVVVPQL